jgi:hypothetical protein
MDNRSIQETVEIFRLSCCSTVGWRRLEFFNGLRVSSALGGRRYRGVGSSHISGEVLGSNIFMSAILRPCLIAIRGMQSTRLRTGSDVG